MDINWLGLIAGAVTLFLINYFSNKASFSVKEGELKFDVFIKGLGILCFMFSVVPFFVLLTGNYQVDKPGETAALICLMIAFGISAIYVLGEGFFIKGSYDIESILFSTPWTGEKNEKWDDLQSAELFDFQKNLLFAS